MADFGFLYWKRVDELRGRGTLSEIAAYSGIKEQSLRNMRSQNRFPKQEVSMKIAEFLNTTVDYLVSGEETARHTDYPEVEYIRNNPEARALVRAIMEDPALLYPLSALVTRRSLVENQENHA